jgi:hypothetical protein
MLAKIISAGAVTLMLPGGALASGSTISMLQRAVSGHNVYAGHQNRPHPGLRGQSRAVWVQRYAGLARPRGRPRLTARVTRTTAGLRSWRASKPSLVRASD